MARDDLELALSLWFDQETVQPEKVPARSMASVPPPQNVDRSTALLAEIRGELSIVEGDIQQVGEMVRGLEKVETVPLF